MNFHPSQRRRRTDALLDLTPLIDIVFLLLIFFLITTTFVRDRESTVAVGLNLPEGVADEMPSEDERLTVVVGIGGDFSLSVDGALANDSVGDDELEEELRTLFVTNPERSVFLRGDRAVDYGRVVDVLLLVREIGFQKVHAVIQDPSIIQD